MASSFDITARIRADAKEFIAGLKSGEVAASSFVTKMGGMNAAIGVGTAMAVAAAGIALYKLGASFEEAYKQIRVGTGKTGEELHGLEQSFRNVFAQTPASMKDVSSTLTDVSVKLGLTGKPLEDLSLQIIKLSRITGTDLKGNTEAVTTVMKNFGVAAGDQKDKLDLLFRASQTSGVSVSTLAQQMASGGVVARSVGLDFEHTAALVGMLAKSGLDLGDVLPGMTKSLTTAAKEGQNASVMFQETFDKIKNAKDPVEAAGIAFEVFGGRGGPKLAAAIREGKLSFEEYMKGIVEGTDTISKASSDVSTVSGKLAVVGHQIQLAFEPLATTIFQGLNSALKALMPAITAVTGALKYVVESFLLLPGPVKNLIPVLAGLVLAMKGLMVMKGIMLALQASTGTAMAAMAASTGQFVMNFIALMPGLEGAAITAGITVEAAFLPIIAVALLAFGAFMLFTSGTRASEKAQKEYKDTLDKTTGAITEQSVELTKSKLQHANVLDSMNKAGISIERVTDFIQNQNSERIRQGELERMIQKITEASAFSEEAANVVRANSAKKLREMGGANNELLASMIEANALTPESINALYDEADAYRDKKKELDSVNTATQVSNGLVGESAREAAAAAQANQAQAKSIQEVIDKHLAATNPVFAALQAQRDASDAQKTLNDLRSQGKFGTDEYNKALDDSVMAGLRFADALTKMDVAQLQGTSSQEKFQNALDQLKRVGINPTAADMELLKTRIEALYGPMNDLKTPSAAYTDILNKMKVDGMDPARIAAENYAGQLQALADKLSPEDPLRKNIEATLLQLFLLGQQKPEIQIRLDAYNAIVAIDDVNERIRRMKEFAYSPGSRDYSSIPQPPGRAIGGPVLPGRPYIVGERGPELFIPGGTSGTIIPNDQLGAAASSGTPMGGSTVILNLGIETVAGDPAAIERVVIDAIARAKRRGVTVLKP